MKVSRNISILDDFQNVGHTPGSAPSSTLFRSPVGTVLCQFRTDGRLSSCQPLHIKGEEIDDQLIHRSETMHPELAKAIWQCNPPPEAYDPLMTSPHWAQSFWEVLKAVPFGTTISYAELASRNGLNKSWARPIAQILSTNPIFILLPCHRVIQSDGKLGGYKWGVELKKRLLEYEARTIKGIHM